MDDVYRKRRTLLALVILIGVTLVSIISVPAMDRPVQDVSSKVKGATIVGLATDALNTLKIKGRSSNSEYSRDKFGSGWTKQSGCDTRNIILNRDLTKVIIDNNCNVTSGVLDDPYSGKVIQFKRGSGNSDDIQIDHVVSLSDAWQKGAQLLTKDQRILMANDPIELLAVDGPTNMQKSDGDAATWLPPNKSFRCQYVARQVAVKQKYELWLTRAEYDAIKNILGKCPNQLLPTE